MSSEQYWQTVQQWWQLEDEPTQAPSWTRLYEQNQTRTHMKIDEMIESKYLKQSDVKDEMTVTVKALKKVNVARDDEDPEYRWTVLFHEFPKPMVLNVTNLKRLAKALGEDTEDWLGNSVLLYVDPDIEFGGNVVGGLRIKSIPRPRTQAGRTSDDDVNRKFADAADDVPF